MRLLEGASSEVAAEWATAEAAVDCKVKVAEWATAEAAVDCKVEVAEWATAEAAQVEVSSSLDFLSASMEANTVSV